MTLAVVSGILLVLSFPDVGHPLVAWVSLVPLLVAIVRAPSAMLAMRHGLVTGVVHFAGVVYWIPRVMSQYGGLPTPLSWGIHALFVLYLALFPAFFAAGQWTLVRRFGVSAVLMAPCVWVTSELGRIYLFTGFPWELLGYSQTPIIPVAQVASVFGVLGLSALVAWVNGAVALVLVDIRPRRWRVAATTAVMLIVVISLGHHRVRSGALTASGDAIRVAAVQGNVAQSDKWDPARRDAILDKYLRLTHQAAEEGAEFVVWPESATPFSFGLDPRADRIRELARARSVHVLFGSTDVVGRDEPEYYNAAIVVDPRGESPAVYHKQHLVPWGEYVPMRGWLFFVSPLVENVGGFTAGADATVLPVRGHGVGTAICYEIIYPGLVRELVTSGSQLLTTVTNDAWYGRTSAPHQHFQMATMRAIEGGRYLVRAANTGISGAIDPYGRVLVRTPLFEDAVVIADVRLLDHATIYSRIGDLGAWVCAGLTLVALVMAVRRRV